MSSYMYLTSLYFFGEVSVQTICPFLKTRLFVFLLLSFKSSLNSFFYCLLFNYGGPFLFPSQVSLVLLPLDSQLCSFFLLKENSTAEKYALCLLAEEMMLPMQLIGQI